jgi:nicotinamidase-related amidase
MLGGVASSIGVEGTARGASELGYNISFAIDAMADIHQSAHDHSVQHIFPRMGEVGTTADILKELAKE